MQTLSSTLHGSTFLSTECVEYVQSIKTNLFVGDYIVPTIWFGTIFFGLWWAHGHRYLCRISS